MPDTAEFPAHELEDERVLFGTDDKLLAKGKLRFDERAPYINLRNNKTPVIEGQHLIPLALGELVRIKKEVAEFTPYELLGEPVMFGIGGYIVKSLIKIDPTGPYVSWEGKRIYIKDGMDVIYMGERVILRIPNEDEFSKR